MKTYHLLVGAVMGLCLALALCLSLSAGRQVQAHVQQQVTFSQEQDLSLVGYGHPGGVRPIAAGAVYPLLTNREAKLTVANSASDDNFGHAVAVSRDTITVGAWGDDDGSKSGSAHIYRSVSSQFQVCNSTKYAGSPVLSVGAGGNWDDEDVWGPAVLEEDGVYRMWYTGYDGSNPFRIGLATSPDGIAWTKDAANPVMSPGPSWETNGVVAGSVITDADLFKMWYSGSGSDGIPRIGYATSSDGVTWTKYGSNPVLGVGSAGSWEDAGVSRPAVITKGGVYHMWYTGYDGVTFRIGHATSGDGVGWARDAANPVLDVGLSGDWDWPDVYAPSVVTYGNTYLMWYSAWTLLGAGQTGYALSDDGSDWIRERVLIPTGSPGAFDEVSADFSSVIVDGDQLKVWYSGLDGGGDYRIGYADAEICGSAGAFSNSIYLPFVARRHPTDPCASYYYADDFSDPSSGWPISDDGVRRLGYVNGEYQIWLKSKTLRWAVTPGIKATDFTVAVSARRASGSGSYGILFGINEDWNEYYEISIGDGSYGIWRKSGGWTALKSWTSSSYINTGTSWNRMKVVRDGNSISFYVNDHLLYTGSDGTLAGLRRIGLVAEASITDPHDARFDDFVLYPADCGASVAGTRAAETGFEMGAPEIHEVPVAPGMDRLP